MAEKIYRCVNAAVLLVAAAFEFLSLRHLEAHFPDYLFLFGLLLVVLTVHILKALRLYILLYGANMPLSSHLRQFCKTTVVSLLMPWKLGDLFRAYCYAVQLKSGLSGIFVILVDRFMDTAGLVFLLLVLAFLRASPATMLLFFWLIFLFLCLLGYFFFPPLYRYWNAMLMESRPATSGKNKTLLILQRCHYLYVELNRLLRGRSFLLFLLSLFAWASEIGGIIMLSWLTNGGGTTLNVTGYLTAALGLGGSVYQSYFAQCSVALMFVLYLALMFAEWKKRAGVS